MSMNVGGCFPCTLILVSTGTCVVETEWMEDGREGLLGIIM